MLGFKQSDPVVWKGAKFDAQLASTASHPQLSPLRSVRNFRNAEFTQATHSGAT